MLFRSEKAYQNVCLAARAKGFRVAVKAHPMQELHRVKEVFSKYCPDALFFQAEDLTDLGLASDFAVIINFSTAIPLVASARIPLLVMVPDEMQEKLSKFYGINSIKNFELSPLSASPAFYQELIDRFSQDLDWRKLRIEGQSAYGELHNGPIDGFSAKRDRKSTRLNSSHT